MMDQLERRLGYQFQDPMLLTEAMTHPSLASESKGPHFDNQRLEFLGDAVLQIVLTEYLFKLFPSFPEGRLTKLRSQLVSRRALAEFARAIELGEFLRLGKGEDATGGRERASILADAFEALLGAVYLDAGLEPTREVILHLLAEDIARVASGADEKNPKGQLQERLQAIEPETPIYEISSITGPDHDRTFHARVVWAGRELAVGSGRTKKEAEARAASEALRRRSWERKGAGGKRRRGAPDH
jgi:ribonuclease-3